MKSGAPGAGDVGEYDGVGFVEISKIFATQDVFCFGTEPFGRAYRIVLNNCICLNKRTPCP